MKKLFVLALGLVFAFSGSAFAQDNAPQTGRRQGTARNQSIRLGVPAGPARLLSRTDVQNDLNLTSEQKTQIEALRTDRRSGRGDGNTRQTREEMQTQREDFEKKLAAILTPEQNQRLTEISVQLQGDLAVMSEDVQKGLEFTPAQQKSVTDLLAKYREAMQSIRTKSQSGDLTRTAAREASDRNNKALGEELRKILTSAQADKLKAMGGKPFIATETPRGPDRS